MPPIKKNANVYMKWWPPYYSSLTNKNKDSYTETKRVNEETRWLTGVEVKNELKWSEVGTDWSMWKAHITHPQNIYTENGRVRAMKRFIGLTAYKLIMVYLMVKFD